MLRDTNDNSGNTMTVLHASLFSNGVREAVILMPRSAGDHEDYTYTAQRAKNKTLGLTSRQNLLHSF